MIGNQFQDPLPKLSFGEYPAASIILNFIIMVRIVDFRVHQNKDGEPFLAIIVQWN